MTTVVALSQDPILRFTYPDGTALAGGFLTTQVGGVNYPTYSESTGTTALPNPIVLNSRGEVATNAGTSTPLYVNPNVAYTFTLQDSALNPIWTAPNIICAATTSAVVAALTQSVLGGILYPITTAESNASVTPTNYWYPPGDVRRYGADILGVADSTVAFNNALKSNGLVYAISGTYKLSAQLVMFSGQTLYGDGAATILQYALGTVNNIYCSGITNCTIRDLKIVVTAVAGGSTVGAIYLLNSTAIKVVRCEFVGMWGGGVFIDCSNDCLIEGNYFHNFNAGGNFGDIMFYCQSSPTNGATNNQIINNQCYGGANAFGISLEDPDTATNASGYPRNNIIQGNRVGQHATYGILLYMSGLGPTPPFGDTKNQVIGNYVEGILGNAFLNTDSGAGIYCVGAGIGGTLVANNTVFNCCINTTTASLAPAGIGLSLVHVGVTPPVITGNVISGMTQGHGILVVSSPGGAVVSNNTVIMPSSNAGAGAGGASLLGRGIQVNSSSLVTIGPNSVQMFGTGQALYIFASQANMVNISVTGGLYTTSSLASSTQALFVTFASSFTVTKLNIANCQFESNGTAATASLAGVVVGSWNNVSVNNAGSGVGLNVAGCTNMRFSGGYINSGGTGNVATSGTCTNSFMDKTVNWGATTGASGSLMSNAGTGFNVEANFTSVPTAGTWVTGDRAVHLGVVVTGAKAWARVTTGGSNTLAVDWISEGNL